MKRLSTMLLVLSFIVIQVSYVPQRAFANEVYNPEFSQEKADEPDSGETGMDEKIEKTTENVDPVTGDTGSKETDTQDTVRDDTGKQDQTPEEAAAGDAGRQETADQGAAAQDSAKQEAADQGAVSQEAAKQEAADQSAAAQEETKQETGDKDAASQEAGSQGAAKQDAAGQDTGDKDGTKQETGDKDAASKNTPSGNTSSGNSPSGNAVSGNAASGKNVSGNAVSANAVSTNGLLKSSGTEAVSLEIKDEIIQLGGFPQEKDESDISKDNLQGRSGEDSFEDKLTKALDDRKENLDVSGYGLSVDEVKQQVIDVINDNPSFFSVEGVSVSLNRASNTASNVLLKYSSNADDRSASYESEVANILAGIRSTWNNEKKLFYLHDYLVTHCQYDLTYSKYSAYDAIVGHSAVCQGYSLAFADLATRAGIPTQVVTSSGLNHAWNISTLNGKQYYTDCTFDDPVFYDDSHWYRMHCSHQNFLASRSQMTATDHTSTDWVVNGTNVYGSYNNTEYDNAGWRKADCSAAAYPENGSIYYLNSENCGIYSYDCNRGAVIEKAKIMESALGWPIYGMPNGFYSYCIGSLTGSGDMIWVNDHKTIYRFNPSNNTLTAIYTLTSSEQNSGYIYGIELEGSRIRYDLAVGDRDTDFVRSGYVDVSSSTGTVVTGLSLDKEYVLFGKAGETVSLTATVTPAGAGSVAWSSSNTSVATVTNGVVRSVGFGSAYIYAKCGGRTATCRVEFQATKDTDRVEAFVTRMYTVVLEREPDADGLAYWTRQLKNGSETGASLMSLFFLGDEITNKHLSNRKYVQLAYQGALGRNPDAEGTAYWVDALDSGTSPQFLVSGCVASQEFKDMCDRYGIKAGSISVSEERDKNLGVTKFVSRLYTKALGRNYDTSGLNYWCGIINANPGRDNVIQVAMDGCFHSQEFLNKNLSNRDFVTVAYRTFLGREADLEGYNYWLGQLAGGMSRDEMIRNCAYSQEFSNIMASYGL